MPSISWRRFQHNLEFESPLLLKKYRQRLSTKQVFLHRLKNISRCMQSKHCHSHWKWLHRKTYNYVPTYVLFFVHSVPVQGGQAIPLYLEAILVMLSSLSTALQQEKEFINVIWWVHKYYMLTNKHSFLTLFQKYFIRNLDHRTIATFTGT